MKKIVLISTFLFALAVMLTCTKFDLSPITKVVIVSAKPGLTSATVTGKIVELSSENHGECGFYYSTNPQPTPNDPKVVIGAPKLGEFTTEITGLTSDTKYYVLVYCKEGNSYLYGDVVEVKTGVTTVTDFDNNTYTGVQIGTQVWMQENLKVTHYRNGDAVANVTDNTAWSSLTTGAYSWYDNKVANKDVYGALYNFYTVVDTRNVCPTGWHVPTETEWTTIVDYLGGEEIAGGKMKVYGLAFWLKPNTDATNSSGFSALAGGYRYNDGSFNSMGDEGKWWASTIFDALNSAMHYIYNNYSAIFKENFHKANGLSIRCIKGEIAVPPTVITTAVTDVTTTTATSGGNVTSDGYSNVTARGVCWSTSLTPTVLLATKTVDGTGAGIFTSNLTSLSPNTKYYIRSYATNSVGTAYGTEVNFTTPQSSTTATLTTVTVTGVTTTTAIGGGNITSDGGATITTRGICWSTAQNPNITLTTKTSDGSGIGSFSSNIIGLLPSTKYYVRAYATNSNGTAYGNEVNFTTLTSISTPTLTTTAISALASTSVNTGGNITSDGGAAVTARGVCWGTSSNPVATGSHTTDAGDTGVMTSNIVGLTPNTIYYIRAYATNNTGTGYGNEISITTTAKVTDYDGNTYNTVQIGTQLWMQENLKATKYRDGSTISNITDNTAWTAQSTGAYCWYNNDEATYKVTFGALYNYYTTVDNRNLCPTGWHVPTDGEWTILSDYLGGESIAGGKMKATTLWYSPNTGADNSSGFAALPSSLRGNATGMFGDLGPMGGWWISTASSSISLVYNSAFAYRGSSGINSGYSVRCLQGEGQVLPAVTTTAATAVTSTTATSGGNVTSDGGAAITERGICFNTSPSPTTTNTKVIATGTTGTFASNLTSLTHNTLYYVRAYATNSAGTAYGNEVNFTTPAAVLTATDYDGNVYNTVTIGTQTWFKENLKTTKYRDGTDIPNITDNTAWSLLTSGSYCWYNNDQATYKATYGALYNYYSTVENRNLCPTGWHVPTDVEWTALTTFLGGESVAGGKLKATTLWNSPNTGADNSSDFTALPGGYRDYSTGIFLDFGLSGNWWTSTNIDASNVWFRGLYYSYTATNRNSRNKNHGFFVRCLQGEGQVLPAITTTSATAMTSTTASSGGNITSDGGATITERGICYNTSPNPTTTNTKVIGTGTIGTFISNLTGLTPNTLYYVRAYAINSVGTAYGNEVSITTNDGVADGDGNIYNIITIGTQIWMAENLKTTKFNDGVNIPLVTDNSAWSNLTTSAYCWYNNNTGYKNMYGALYNYYTAEAGNLCPTGWRIPSDQDWKDLEMFLGMTPIDADKTGWRGSGFGTVLKSTTGWSTNGSNTSGFTGLPGGDRSSADGSFNFILEYGYWWSTTPSGMTNYYYIRDLGNGTQIGRSGFKNTMGLSVRCIKN